MVYLVLIQCLVNFFLTFYLKRAYSRIDLLKQQKQILEEEKQTLEEEFDNFVDLFNKQEIERQDALGQKLVSTLEKEIYSQMLLQQEPYGDA